MWTRPNPTGWVPPSHLDLDSTVLQFANVDGIVLARCESGYIWRINKTCGVLWAWRMPWRYRAIATNRPFD